MSKLSELTLLYVEDDLTLREQFTRILKPKFKGLHLAKDGLEALEKYRTHKPNMIVLDINIPKMGGLEVLEEIRKYDKKTAILILSAYSDRDKLFRVVTLGLSGYLVKPVPHKVLLSDLEEIAEQLKVEDSDSIKLSDTYVWHEEERRLCYLGEPISLTKRESILLAYLIENKGKIISFFAIENLIWEESEFDDHRQSLAHLIKRLRKKLPEALIQNIYGEGYSINVS